MFIRWLHFCVRNRLVVWAIVIACSVLAMVGVKRLHLDTGLDSLIPPMDPEIVSYDRIVKEFGTDNRVIVYLRDEALWSPTRLEALEMMRDELLGLEFVERVDSLFTAKHISGVDDTIAIQSLVPSKPWTAESLQRSKQNALQHPILIGNLLSEDGFSTILVLSVKESDSDKNGYKNIYERIETVILDAKYAEKFERVFQLGDPRMRSELESVFFKDIQVLGPLSALLLILSLYLFLRKPVAPLVAILTSVLSILWTFGLVGWFGMPLNILSVMLPTLIIVIGSTEDTHMITSYYWGLSRFKGKARVRASSYMIRHMGIPLILTVLTTGVGFAANIISDIGLIRNFAILATTAILINGLVTLLLVPLFLRSLGQKKILCLGITGKFKGFQVFLFACLDWQKIDIQSVFC